MTTTDTARPSTEPLDLDDIRQWLAAAGNGTDGTDPRAVMRIAKNLLAEIERLQPVTECRSGPCRTQ